MLAHVISEENISLYPDKIISVISWPVSTSVNQVQSFVGFMCFYWIFIHNFAKQLHPIVLDSALSDQHQDQG